MSSHIVVLTDRELDWIVETLTHVASQDGGFSEAERMVVESIRQQTTDLPLPRTPTDDAILATFVDAVGHAIHAADFCIRHSQHYDSPQILRQLSHAKQQLILVLGVISGPA